MLQKPSDMMYFIIQNVSAMTLRPRGTNTVFHLVHISIQIVGLSLFLLNAIVYVISKEYTFYEKMEALHFVIAGFHIVTKHLNIMFRKREVRKIAAELDKLWIEAKQKNIIEDEFNATNARIIKRVSLIYVTFLSAVVSSGWLAFITTFNSSKDDWKLPLRIWAPFDKSYYWSNFCWHVYSFLCCLISISGSCSYLFISAEYIALQLKVLSSMLQQRCSVNYIQPYLLHQKILRLNRDLNELLSAQFCLQMIINSGEVAARCYAFLMALQNPDLMIIPCFIMVFLSIEFPFTICFCGNIIASENERLFIASYQNSWYEENSKDAKHLLMLTTMATKPMILHYRHLITFGMSQFTTFCQAVYSYIMVLRFFGSGK